MPFVHVVVGGAETEHRLCLLDAKTALNAAHQALVVHHKLGPTARVLTRLKHGHSLVSRCGQWGSGHLYDYSVVCSEYCHVAECCHGNLTVWVML